MERGCGHEFDVRGPDAIKLFSDLCSSSFTKFDIETKHALDGSDGILCLEMMTYESK